MVWCGVVMVARHVRMRVVYAASASASASAGGLD